MTTPASASPFAPYGPAIRAAASRAAAAAVIAALRQMAASSRIHAPLSGVQRKEVA